jgi:ribosomal-protein-alanine N-acetyltransferase
VSGQTIERVLTTRLSCERVRPDAAGELSALLLDPQVVRSTWSGPEPPTESDVIEKVAADDGHWQRYGFGPWLLRDRAGGEMVGRGGLRHTMATGVDEVEVGWSIVPERWGQGLATELALVSVRVAFDTIGLGELIAYTLPDNVASRRVMEKAGFEFDREFQHVGLGHVLYRRSRAVDH